MSEPKNNTLYIVRVEMVDSMESKVYLSNGMELGGLTDVGASILAKDSYATVSLTALVGDPSK